MSRTKSLQELNVHKEKALQKLEAYFDSLISSGDAKLTGKADKLSYWIEDWVTFLDFESRFSPKSLRRYKRGEIIKVHLGFNVGSEEGGLHYAVVLDRNNAKSSPVVTIIPLTSVKSSTDLANLKSGCVFLGNELFTNLNSKMSAKKKSIIQELSTLHSLLEQLKKAEHPSQDEIDRLIDRILKLDKELSLSKQIETEIKRMRQGSIALVGQITTISKIRIYDPKTDHDILSGIKLSNEKLDLIDSEIHKLFTNA